MEWLAVELYGFEASDSIGELVHNQLGLLVWQGCVSPQ